ncbi:tripartite tricarboxylate transporter substrate binding protein [Nocardiopsis ganjiahuensis]|uniref:tripartite tricarboxylate transporter substrate binding protein n=1 Tax=Nocardiopsis ganjiahuensis TaxID=239984 RepID=UPI0003471E51|nr:tripartite tricarboxylate transporter substrate binding protein [Nocardiopsis ganjiahuensis]
MTRRLALPALASALALAATACGGEAATADPDRYPERPVTMLVGFAPGGGTDTIARNVARCLNERLDREVVVENKPGGSQAIALNDLLGAPADGHTMAMVTTSGPVVVPLRVPTVGYDKDDFTQLNEVTHAPSVLITPADLHEEVGPGFLDREEDLVVSTPGALSAPHQTLNLLADVRGAPLRAVPYEGSRPAITALLAGDVDAVFTESSKEVMDQLEDTGLHVSVSGGQERMPHIPDVPTFEELGYDGLPMSDSFWFPVLHGDTPDELVELLEGHTRSCAESPELAEAVGEDYVANDRPTSSDLSRQVMDAMHESFVALIREEES